MEKEEGVEHIRYVDEGREAMVDLELRSKFPGLGGTIVTYQAIAVAHRQEKNPVIDSGHRNFLRHAIIKKLEDYFFKKEIYRFAHISRPLGSKNTSYIYEWVFGTDGFAWIDYDDNYNFNEIPLDDWDRFCAVFQKAGINLSEDIVEPNSYISKNIVHQYPYKDELATKLNRLWKRIDLGPCSIKMNYELVLEYLCQNEDDIRRKLKSTRFDFMELACNYLLGRFDTNGITDKPEIEKRQRNIKRLKAFTLEYRVSTLMHLNARGIGHDSTPTIREPEDEDLE